jgi:probable lipoprotein (TIGR04455 family)
MKAFLAAVVLCGGMACSHVKHTYVSAGYNPASSQAVKKIAVATWAWPEQSGYAGVLAAVVRDVVKLRSNYLLYSAAPAVHVFTEACSSSVQGVLWVRAQEVLPGPQHTQVKLFLELYACDTGALLWRTQASREVSVHQPHLKNMVQQYVDECGPQASQVAAAFFVLIQEAVRVLPNPVLSDEDMMEKIESDL